MTIIALIVVNAITLGLETTNSVHDRWGGLLIAADRLLLLIFTAELIARAPVYKSRFFHDPWRIFDLIVAE